MSPWAWLAVAMLSEAILFLWLAVESYEAGYVEGVKAMHKLWEEQHRKERSR